MIQSTSSLTAGRQVVGGLLGIHALTALHPGSGTALGTVDLPVQRERHTMWPTIAGSAMKGVLRDACREKIVQEGKLEDEPNDLESPRKKRKSKRELGDQDQKLVAIFGASSGNNSESAGAVSVTDARLLAYPVRSLKGVFAWITCPAVLERLQRDANLAGRSMNWTIPSVGAEQVATPPGCTCLLDGTTIILEESDFRRLGAAEAELQTKAIADWISRELLPHDDHYAKTVNRFKSHLAILSDDSFTYFVRHATEISARIGLDYNTKTVKDGALFYQEFLPTETLLYSIILMNQSRSRNDGSDAASLMASFRGWLPNILQIGGDETTGKGFCSIWPIGKGT